MATFHAHCDVISEEYVTDKVQNQGEGQYSFSLQKYDKFNVQIRNFWYLRTLSFNHSINTGVKTAEVHAETLNVITAIKLSHTDNVVGSRRY